MHCRGSEFRDIAPSPGVAACFILAGADSSGEPSMGELGLSGLEDPGLVGKHLVGFCQDAAAEEQSGNDVEEHTGVALTVVNDGVFDQVYDEFGSVRVGDVETGSTGLMVYQTKDNVACLEVENKMGESASGGKDAEESDGLVLEGEPILSGKEADEVDVHVVDGNPDFVAINVEVDSGDTCDDIGVLCLATCKVEEDESINLEWARHILSNDLEAKKEEKKADFHNRPDDSVPVSQDVSQETVHHPFFIDRKSSSSDQVMSRNTQFFPVGQCDENYFPLKQSLMLNPSCPETPSGAASECSQPLCNSTAHIATDADNRSDDKSNPAPTCRRTNPKRAASIRNSSNVSKPNHYVKANKFQNTVKAVVNGTSFSSSMVHKFSNKERRKRSFRNIVHTSGWGTMEKLFEIISLSDIVNNNNSELVVTRRKSTKVRCFSGRKRHPKTRKVGKGPRNSDPAINRSAENATQLFSPALVNSPAPVNADFNDGLRHIDCQIIPSEIDQDLPVEEYNTMLIPNRYVASQSPLMPMSGDWRHSDKDPESSVTQETSPENYLRDFPGSMSQVGNETLMELGDGKLSNYSGTSSESDVVQPAAYLTVSTSPSLFSDNKPRSENHSPDFSIHDSLHPDVCAVSILESGSASSLHQCISTMKERNINSEEVFSESFSEEERVEDCSNEDKERKPSKHSISGRRKQVGLDHRFNHSRNNDRRSSKKCLKPNDILVEQPSMETELQSHSRNLEVQSDECKSVIPGQKSGGKMAFKDFKAKGRKTKSKFLGSSRDKNNDHQKNEENQNAVCTHITYKRGLLRKFAVDKGSQLLGMCTDGSGALSNLCSDMVDTSLSNRIDKSSGLNDKLVLKSSDKVFEPHPLPPQAAWVQCDDCHKWRCIPTELADYIDERKCRWTCKENQDKAFSDCSTPQEKSNAEINAELEISEASCEEEGSGTQRRARKIENINLSDKPHSSWTRIRSNLYLHRSRKTQTIDETMVCQCRLRKEGVLGCGDECLNRMLNIECVRGTCPCGERCSNQQFQKRKYAKLKPFPCGKKGHGLQVLENVSQGQFLIEYVGEVLDLATYEARQREYASRGQKHFYFMTLNGSEVIDACSKGNLGRFINHSCDPNCRTEKWMVNGEVCIGLFAIRDINKGEEVTFDYNYVRVVGAAAKKCVCGSADCKGYIGGDPSNTETAILVDSDDEFFEPPITYGHCIQELDKRGVFLDTHEIGTRNISMDKNVSNDNDACGGKIVDMDRTTQNNTDIASAQGQKSSPLNSDKLSKSSTSNANLDISLPTTDTTSGTTSAGQTEILLQSSNPVGEIKLNPIIKSMTDLSTAYVDGSLHPFKAYASKNSYRFGGPTKKSGFGVKNILVPDAKKIVGGNHNNHFNGVEEKLSEVLDADGGISKRKDATKGFLKLLVVTAALRDNAASEAIQSTRDLCLILDALLKTKSRSVLLDIINKNGLQMLHNIMKQSRKSGNKIPVLRKLLKVLESLSQREILTDELINMAPSCLGVESFRDSITSLTYHNDIQVHQIARSFRDKWFRVRKPILSEVGERRLDTQNANANWFVPHSMHYQEQDATDANTRDANQASFLSSSSSGTCSTSEPSFSLQHTSPSTSASSNAVIGVNPRKRKSRWDQDKPMFKVNSDPNCFGSINDGPPGAVSGLIKPEAKSHLDKSDDVTVSRKDEDFSNTGASNNLYSRQQVIDEAPPGFGSSAAGFISSSERSIVSFDWPCTDDNVVTGILQERYCPLLSVSHGIPVTLMQQLGTPANIDHGNSSLINWDVAPGMPFHPFPPLPTYPREKNYNGSPGESSLASSRQTMARDGAEKQCLNGKFDTACQPDYFVPGAAGSALCGAKPDVQSNFIIDRGRKPSSRSEKMHCQRRNNPGHHKFRPPWPRGKGNQDIE